MYFFSHTIFKIPFFCFSMCIFGNSDLFVQQEKFGERVFFFSRYKNMIDNNLWLTIVKWEKFDEFLVSDRRGEYVEFAHGYRTLHWCAVFPESHRRFSTGGFQKSFWFNDAPSGTTNTSNVSGCTLPLGNLLGKSISNVHNNAYSLLFTIHQNSKKCCTHKK